MDMAKDQVLDEMNAEIVRRISALSDEMIATAEEYDPGEQPEVLDVING